MWVILSMIGILGFYNTDDMRSFSKKSNGMGYEFVWSIPCDSGLKSSGFSISPTGNLYLKQINKDGSVGHVCRN